MNARARIATFLLVHFWLRGASAADSSLVPNIFAPESTPAGSIRHVSLLVLSLSTARVIHEIQDAPMPASALNVEVIGHQWWWEVHYPKLGIVTANELHVPVSTVTGIELRSADVVHSFWVPRLAGKTDLYPNKVNKTWVQPTRTGLFLGQ